MSKPSKYIDYLRNNPNASKEEFIAATGGTKQNWYQARHDLKLTKPAAKVAKKKPINLGAVSGTRPSKESVVVHRLHQQIVQLEAINNSLRVVISYLETQLGLKQSGSSV